MSDSHDDKQLGLDSLIGSELGNDSGTKEAVNALMTVSDEVGKKSDIDFKTDLLPREINGMAAAETLGRIATFTVDKKTGEITADHSNLLDILTEHIINHKRLRVSKLRQGRSEVRSIFTPINPMMQQPQGDGSRRGGWLAGLFRPRGGMQ